MSRRPKRALIIIGGASLALIAAIIFLQPSSSDKNALQFGSQKLFIEEVRSPQAQQRGLGGRSSIADNYGMLFVYETSDEHCFWMKDMRFSIDMIWLDAAKKVIHIEQGVSPSTYPNSFCPPSPARYVLEVQAGLSQRSGIDVGSQL